MTFDFLIILIKNLIMPWFRDGVKSDGVGNIISYRTRLLFRETFSDTSALRIRSCKY